MAEKRRMPPSLAQRILARLGYVPAATARDLAAQVTAARARMTQVTQQLEQARVESGGRKKQADVRLNAVQQKLERLEESSRERLEKARRQAQHETERVRKHDARRAATLDSIRERMSWAEHSNKVGHEHLMAIEVKLDILEGAITVLDRRTRAALSQKMP